MSRSPGWSDLNPFLDDAMILTRPRNGVSEKRRTSGSGCDRYSIAYRVAVLEHWHWRIGIGIWDITSASLALDITGSCWQVLSTPCTDLCFRCLDPPLHPTAFNNSNCGCETMYAITVLKVLRFFVFYSMIPVLSSDIASFFIEGGRPTHTPGLLHHPPDVGHRGASRSCATARRRNIPCFFIEIRQ